MSAWAWPCPRSGRPRRPSPARRERRAASTPTAEVASRAATPTERERSSRPCERDRSGARQSLDWMTAAVEAVAGGLVGASHDRRAGSLLRNHRRGRRFQCLGSEQRHKCPLLGELSAAMRRFSIESARAVSIDRTMLSLHARRLYAVPIAALLTLSALYGAGCGGDDDNSSSGSSGIILLPRPVRPALSTGARLTDRRPRPPRPPLLPVRPRTLARTAPWKTQTRSRSHRRHRDRPRHQRRPRPHAQRRQRPRHQRRRRFHVPDGGEPAPGHVVHGRHQGAAGGQDLRRERRDGHRRERPKSTSIVVNCGGGTFTVGGTLTGLSGGSVVLTNNGGDDLTLTSNNTFAFGTAVGRAPRTTSR